LFDRCNSIAIALRGFSAFYYSADSFKGDAKPEATLDDIEVCSRR
jgi:hypothetical protein